MTKKGERIIRRKKVLEEAVKAGLAFCEYHRYALEISDLHRHRCHIGNHGKNYCRYLIMLSYLPTDEEGEK